MRLMFRGAGTFLAGLIALNGSAGAVTDSDLKDALVDDATTLANVTALTVDAGVLSTSAADVDPGFPSQITVLSAYLPGGASVLPTKGGSFVALSSGDLFHPAEFGDVDYGTVGDPDDTATITVTLNVPVGANAIAFDFEFLSYEFPEFVGSTFNDFFTATIADAGGTRQVAEDAFGNDVTVNTVFFNPALSLAGTGFDLVNDESCPLPVCPDSGRTGTLTTLVPITPGSTTVTLTFSTGDVGDGLFTSSAVVDNLRFSGQILTLPATGETTVLTPGVITGQMIFTDTVGNHLNLTGEVNTAGQLTVFSQLASSVSPGRFPTGSGLSPGGDSNAALFTLQGFEGLSFKTTTQNGGTQDLQFVMDVPGPFDPTMGLCRADDESSSFADITTLAAECILIDGSPCDSIITTPVPNSLPADPTRVRGSTPSLSQYVPCHRDPVLTLEGGAESLDLCHSGAGDSVTVHVTATFNPNPALLTVRYQWTVPTEGGPVSSTTTNPEITFVPPLGSSTVSVYAELLDAGSLVVGTSPTVSLALNKPSFIGFLDPINNDGSSVLNGTKSIPVKFMVECDGGFVGDLTARLELEKGGVISSGGELSSGNSNADDLFKYDSSANHYRYTLQSKTLTPGIYTIRVTFDGGVLPKQEVTIHVQ
ncbi:MAG: choice-of-anchor L domain-containing protein [Acidobacteria bacterium]|nr:choice-of-anchor L domain-containing protein [Acidobacteriota bacterium]